MAAVSLSEEFFSRSPVTCARELIGCGFRWRGVGGVIVETEAYSAEGDPACHTFFKPSARDFVTDQPVGCSYVYLNYGMYWLVNILTKSDEQGDGFVLLRALHPRWGLAQMRERRQRRKDTDLCSGPGKLSMALGWVGSSTGFHCNPVFKAPANLFSWSRVPGSAFHVRWIDPGVSSPLVILT